MLFVIRLVILIIASIIGKELNNTNIDSDLSTFINIGVWFLALYIIVLCKSREDFRNVGGALFFLPLLGFLSIAIKYFLYSVPVLLIIKLFGSWENVFMGYNISLALGGIYELIKMNNIKNNLVLKNDNEYEQKTGG